MEEREGKGLTLKRIALILIVACLLQPLAACAERTGDAGYAAMSANLVHELEQTSKFQKKELWIVPTYERSGEGWTENGTLPHKTEVIVREKIASDEEGGYLLVETADGQEQVYISTDNYLPKELRYRAQDGTIVSYYLYVPETENADQKWPILIYFHGTRDTVERHHGIGELLPTNRIKPNGIVILPQAVNETTDADFQRLPYQDAVIELAKDIAGKYGGDLSRLSVSGHSDGGSAAYKIVNRHPGLFAACAPISAIGTTEEGIKRTNLWYFQGAKDPWVKMYIGLRVPQRCENSGCNAMHYVYKNEGHEIQTMVFQDTFTDENGRETKLIDWLMSKQIASE